jgi:transposase
MSKHKSEDYKITAVKYYLENDTNYTKTCEIFKCSERSLKRWIERYEELEEIKRLNRKPVSYKITKEQVKYSIQKLKENEQITMEELHKIVKKKYKDFDITPQHLGQVIRDNNITRKRTRHEHYPKERYGKPTHIKKELKTFYNEVSKYSLNKIISLDETSIQPSMIMEFSKCSLGKRCVVKTDDNYVFRKFTLLCAISNSKCVGATFYKEGGMTKERFVEFLEANIFNKYKNHLIILDNAGSHNNEYVKQAIINSGNKYLFSLPYTPKTNRTIEEFFNQIKHYLKLNKKVLKYDELAIEIKNAIKQVKKENYKNYFENAYNKDAYKDYVKKDSTLKRKPKNYKD